MHLLLISNQRSGNNAVRSILTQSIAELQFGGDIFTLGSRDYRAAGAGYFEYLSKIHTPLDLDTFFGDDTTDQAYKRALKYIQYLDDMEDSYIFEVKYSNFKVFDFMSSYPTEMPIFLNAWMQQKKPIIHLIRSNIFSIQVSREFRNTTNISHYRSYKKIDTANIPAIRIDPEQVDRNMRLIKDSQILFSNYLREYKNKVEIIYENDLVDSQLQKAVWSKIEETFKLKADLHAKSQLIKTPFEYREKIVNQEEILEYFNGNYFEDQVAEFFAKK